MTDSLDEAGPAAGGAVHEEDSRGTMALAMAFLVLLVLMWGYVFLLMIRAA